MTAQFIRFGVVGTIGFVVDAAVLYCLLALSLGYFEARLISFLCAAYVTWCANRRFTFSADASSSRIREWAKYMAAMSLGGFVNLAIYRVVMNSGDRHGLWPLAAVAAGSIGGMFVNFVAAKVWVFRRRKAASEPM